MNALQLLVGAPIPPALLPDSIDEACGDDRARSRRASIPTCSCAGQTCFRPNISCDPPMPTSARACRVVPANHADRAARLRQRSAPQAVHRRRVRLERRRECELHDFQAGAGHANVRLTEAQRNAALANYQRRSKRPSATSPTPSPGAGRSMTRSARAGTAGRRRRQLSADRSALPRRRSIRSWTCSSPSALITRRSSRWCDQATAGKTGRPVPVDRRRPADRRRRRCASRYPGNAEQLRRSSRSCSTTRLGASPPHNRRRRICSCCACGTRSP